jgi:hypothetical protein
MKYSVEQIIHKLSTCNEPSSTTDPMNIDNIRTDEEIHAYNLFDIQDRGSVNFE